MLFPTAGLAAMPDRQPSRVALMQMVFVSFLSQLGPSHFCLNDSQQFCVVAQNWVYARRAVSGEVAATKSVASAPSTTRPRSAPTAKMANVSLIHFSTPALR